MGTLGRALRLLRRSVARAGDPMGRREGLAGPDDGVDEEMVRERTGVEKRAPSYESEPQE